MTAAPVLSYGTENKTHALVRNGLRRMAGVSLFVPITVIVIKCIARANYVNSCWVGIVPKTSAPLYGQYAVVVMQMLDRSNILGYSPTDMMVALVTAAAFCAVLWRWIGERESSPGTKRRLIMSGLALILAADNLTFHWAGDSTGRPYPGFILRGYLR